MVATVTGLPLSLGHRIGGLGLLERENATILNAALGDVIEHVIDGLEVAVAALGPDVRAYLTQNDGTVMAPGFARDTPILTIGSGPSNSLRGAAALTSRTDVLVADVGGTSTDVGSLTRGFPRESAAGVTVGGVRTNFRMPDLVSVAVGGGTTILEGSLTATSVARRITEEALVFGGSTATLTDAAVAAGRVAIGDVVRVAGRDDLAPALRQAEALVADAIDRMRLSADEVDLIVVGGGSVLLPDALPGVRSLVRPEHADVANAVGAALAPVAGEAELIADVGDDRRLAEIDRCLDEARQRAVAAGADAAQPRDDLGRGDAARLPGSPAVADPREGCGPRGLALAHRRDVVADEDGAVPIRLDARPRPPFVHEVQFLGHRERADVEQQLIAVGLDGGEPVRPPGAAHAGASVSSCPGTRSPLRGRSVARRRTRRGRPARSTASRRAFAGRSRMPRRR